MTHISPLIQKCIKLGWDGPENGWGENPESDGLLVWCIKHRWSVFDEVFALAQTKVMDHKAYVCAARHNPSFLV